VVVETENETETETETEYTVSHACPAAWWHACYFPPCCFPCLFSVSRLPVSSALFHGRIDGFSTSRVHNRTRHAAFVSTKSDAGPVFGSERARITLGPLRIPRVPPRVPGSESSVLGWFRIPDCGRLATSTDGPSTSKRGRPPPESRKTPTLRRCHRSQYRRRRVPFGSAYFLVRGQFDFDARVFPVESSSCAVM